MANPTGIANMIVSFIHDLNPANYDTMSRKVVTLPVTTKSHLNDIAGAIHARALARPQHVKLYAELCAKIISGGFDGARPGSGPAFQTALLPKCYDKLHESCRTTAATRFKRPDALKRQTDFFVTNCVFIGELYRLGVYPETIVWSFVNDLLSSQSCDTQVRCLCALLSSVAPKMSETYTMTSEMSLKMKTTIDRIRQTYWTDWIRETSDKLAKKRLTVDKEYSFEPSDDKSKTTEMIHVDTLEILLKLMYKQYPEKSFDIERLLTPSLISTLERDQVTLIVSLNRVAFAHNDEKMCTVVGVLLADFVNAKRLTKYAVVKGFHVMLNAQEAKEQYPDTQYVIEHVRNTFEDRLDSVNPVNESIFVADQTSQWFDCSSIKQMINVEFLEFLVKFGSKIHFKERHDIVRLVKPVLLSMLKHDHVNIFVSICYTAIHSKVETVRVNAGKCFAGLVLTGRLRKMSVVKGFCKILTDVAFSEYFTNIPELLATIRSSFENELNL